MPIFQKKPSTLNELYNKCYDNNEDGRKARYELLREYNSAFYQTIINAIVAKNKFDLPKLRKATQEELKFQNEIIKILLQAIIEKESEKEFPLAQLTVMNATKSGVKTLGVMTGLKKGSKGGYTLSSQIQKSPQKGAKKNIDSLKKKENKINLKNKDKK
jgi:hypothetical protein